MGELTKKVLEENGGEIEAAIAYTDMRLEILNAEIKLISDYLAKFGGK